MMATSVQPTAAVWVEYVGRITKDTWVPFFVLYDPPGDKSYARITETVMLHTKVKFGGGFGGSSVTGGFEGSMTVQTDYQTPDGERMHCVLACEFVLVWDIYYYITPSYSGYRAKLVSATSKDGQAIIRFDNLENFDILVEDQTGQEGEYGYHRHVGKNAAMTERFEYTWTRLYYTHLGIKFSFKYVEFTAGVSIESEDQRTFEALYHYESTEENLDFMLYSNYDINFESPPPNFVDNIQIWFSE